MKNLDAEIQQESASAARLILKSCEKLQFELPKNKMSFSTNSEPFLHLQIKQKASHKLGLLGKNKSQLESKIKELESNIADTLKWIISGKELFEEKSNHPSEFIPNAYFLLCLELEGINSEIPKDFYIAYFVLALYLIAEYEIALSRTFGNEDDFENPSTALEFTKKSASAHEYLMLSQSAIELGAASERAFHLGLDRKNETEDLNTILNLAIEAIEHRGHIKSSADKRSKKAREKWEPLLVRVDRLIADGQSITNACRIVARKHGDEEDKDGTKLRQAYYRHRVHT